MGEPPAAPHAADAPPQHCSPQDVQWRLVGLWPLQTLPTRDAAAPRETQGGSVGLPPLQKQLARPDPTSQATPDPASLNLDINASGLAAKKRNQEKPHLRFQRAGGPLAAPNTTEPANAALRRPQRASNGGQRSLIAPSTFGSPRMESLPTQLQAQPIWTSTPDGCPSSIRAKPSQPKSRFQRLAAVPQHPPQAQPA